VWLFGSLARGDWDAHSDVDLLALAPDQSAADQLAEALLGAGLADDVIGLSQTRWLQRQRGDDPLKPLQRMTTASRYPDGDEAPVDLFDERDGALALAVARAVVDFADQQLGELDGLECT